ncbi:hypothetical protein KBD18_02035, partial [Patescibacteria group bacterium]|nr:hypothetical protein [Patescibacteria group bacterium]
KDTVPLLYEVDIENARLLDFRRDDVLQTWLPKFRTVLQNTLDQLREQDGATGKRASWHVVSGLKNAIGEIDKGFSPGWLQVIFASQGGLLTNFLMAQGFDGILADEGGEAGVVGPHDTFVIFDPKKLKMIQKKSIS